MFNILSISYTPLPSYPASAVPRQWSFQLSDVFSEQSFNF